MFNQKVEMAFDALQVKALEGLISFTNMIGLRSTGTSSTWRGQEREIGEKEMNKFKRHPTTSSSYSSCNL